MRSGERLGSAAAQRGFGYLLALFAIAAIGLLLAGAGEVWSTTMQREKEVELLWIGEQFRRALSRYQQSSPEAASRAPATLQELLEDRRFPTPRRHLRQIYRDPLTGQRDWGLVRLDGRIVAIHSLSSARPLKQRFDGRDADLTGKQRYSDWLFSATVAGDAAGESMRVPE